MDHISHFGSVVTIAVSTLAAAISAVTALSVKRHAEVAASLSAQAQLAAALERMDHQISLILLDLEGTGSMKPIDLLPENWFAQCNAFYAATPQDRWPDLMGVSWRIRLIYKSMMEVDDPPAVFSQEWRADPNARRQWRLEQKNAVAAVQRYIKAMQDNLTSPKYGLLLERARPFNLRIWVLDKYAFLRGRGGYDEITLRSPGQGTLHTDANDH